MDRGEIDFSPVSRPVGGVWRLAGHSVRTNGTRATRSNAARENGMAFELNSPRLFQFLWNFAAFKHFGLFPRDFARLETADIQNHGAAARI